MTPREHHREIVSYLETIGATAVRIEQRGKHPHVVFAWHGRELRSALASTPGDFKASRAAIKNLRHQLGLVGGRRVGERRRRKYRRRCPAPAAGRGHAYRIYLIRDLLPFNTPFAGLAALLEIHTRQV